MGTYVDRGGSTADWSRTLSHEKFAIRSREVNDRWVVEVCDDSPRRRGAVARVNARVIGKATRRYNDGMSKPRIGLSTLAISLSVLCVAFAILAVERYYADATAPLWLLPRVFGGAIAGAAVGYSVGELLGGRRGALIGIASGFVLGWNAAVLSATAVLVRGLP